MAFSPFNIFRRNQKAIFAVITVFIMFTFVLSSGLGGGADFFDWFPRWLGGAGKRGDALCTIEGDRVYDRDVREARFNRVMANRYMILAAQVSASSLRRDAQEKLVEATPMLAEPARQALEGKNPQIFQMMAQMMAASPNARPQDRNLVNVVQAWMEVEAHRVRAEQTGGTYFLNAPNRTARDVVDFMLWERKADRLGIQFTDEDVRQLVQRECMGQLRSDVELREVMTREYPGRFTPNTVWRVLASEFRVRAAQTALLGPVSENADRTLTAAPIFTTPHDLYSYYKTNASPTSYQVLAIPAAGFASQVKAEPSPSEFERLWADRKDYEPDPSREEAGFKEPRKVKVEWVSAAGDEPYYKKAAADWIARTELFAKGGIATLTVPTPGAGPAGWAGAATAGMAVQEPLVHAAYKALSDAHQRDLSFRWGGPAGFLFPSQLLNSSFGMWTRRAERTKADVDAKRPVYAAGPELAAELTALGAAGVGGGSLIQPAAFYAQAVAHEARDRGATGGLLFLAGVPGPAMLQDFVAAEAGYRLSLPPALPLAAVRAELLTELTEKKARDLAVADLKKLQTELVRLGENGRAKDKGAAARDFAAAFIKERGLRTGVTPEGVSEWTVRDDPALAPLRESYQKAGSAIDPHFGTAVPFGQKFFSSLDPQRRARVTAGGLYLPEFYPERAAETAAANREPVFLAWRTEDKPAAGLAKDKARPLVVEAWRRVKGRDEAKAVAEQFAARIRSTPGAGPAQFVPVMYDLQTELQGKLADPKDRDRVKLFKLDNVAPIQILNDASGMARPFSLVGTPEIPFPSADMAKKLLDERSNPPKTVFVAADAPRDVYYVFALWGKQDRSVEDFRTHLYSPLGRGPVRELVLAGHAREAVTRARDSVIGLLKKEFAYEESDAQKEKLDERDKKGED